MAPAALLAITPDWVPYPQRVILITGVLEVVSRGVADALAQGRRRCLRDLCDMRVASQLQHSLKGIDVGGTVLSWWYHGPRLALQPAIVWGAAVRVGGHRTEPSSAHRPGGLLRRLRYADVSCLAVLGLGWIRLRMCRRFNLYFAEGNELQRAIRQNNEPARSEAKGARRFVTDAPARARIAMRWVLAAFFAAAGVAHLLVPPALLAITPDWVPYPQQVIFITGVLELVGAVALLTRWRKAAGVAFAVYAICVWPANFKHAFDGIEVGGTVLSWWYHGPRLMLQPVIVWAVLFASEVTDWPWWSRSRP